jgi:uncharacterized Zn-binding protein involved in type VI secretion
MMKLNLSILFVPLLLLSNIVGANAATTIGPSALALAALVADHSPSLTTAQKSQMAWLLDGKVGSISTTAGGIKVTADRVACKASNVDISARSCTIAFGTTTITLKGRLANELGATLAQAGAAAQGGAGTISIGITQLSCSIGPQLIRQRSGAGANCTYQPI